MSEEFRRVQYVEVTDPMWPKLHRKALPVSRWDVECKSDRIVGVYVYIAPHELYFSRSQVRLYIGGIDNIQIVTATHTARLFGFMKRFKNILHQG